MVNFNGYIYAEASNNSGAQVWRSSDGTNWSQVTSSGFNDSNNTVIHSQAIFNGYLYLPTENNITGTEVWRTDGTTWTQVNIDGFGDLNNIQARALGIEGGYLYFGTHNEKTGAEVWRTDGTTWEQVNKDGFDDIKNFKIVPGLTYGGYVYAVTKNNNTGAEVWRFNPQIFDPQDTQTAWEQINVDGFGNVSNNGSAPSVFKGKLYVGTQNNTGGSIYRYKGNLSDPIDPANWEQVASSGINDIDNIAIMLTPGVVTDTLYAGAANFIDGSKIFKTTDGDNWTQISTGGFGDINNISDIWPWLIDNGYLYAGTVNSVTGGEIWALQLDATSPTTPTNLNAIPMSSSQINLSWNASTDNIGVTGYKIYNADNNAEIATTASTSYSHSGLNSDATYRYYVKAYDGAGNLSGSSSTVSATTYKAPVSTSTGTDVPASLGNNVNLNFDQVTGSGTTSVTVSTTAPAPSPSGFNLLGLYYDVSTTATFSGKIRVTFPYDESQVTGAEADLRLFHWEGGIWKDVTVLPVDTANNLITGEVTSLSPFSVGSPSGSGGSVPSTGYNTYWLLIVGISLMIGGGHLLLREKRFN
ncbi:MAG: fibronectin type III domain-containing protein [Actinobacteria bacterium]|nr:fibronectin type III domain-containing protein [Actinomycetota bacterium]